MNSPATVPQIQKSESDILDMVNNPPHYTFSGVEVITAIDAWGLGFCLGNTVKYIARANHKNNKLEDLKKAAWYLAHEIARLEGEKEV